MIGMLGLVDYPVAALPQAVGVKEMTIDHRLWG